MRISPKARAAMLLIEVCEKVGQPAPDHAKSIVHGISSVGSDSIEKELLILLNKMDVAQREQLLIENKYLALWYYLYGKAENSKDVESPMLTGNVDAEGVRNQQEFYPEQPQLNSMTSIRYLKGA